MKKKISLLVALAMLAAVLGGCQLFCKHEWQEATCEKPQTCAKCEKIEGEALGHDWQDATCETPETCNTCGMTQGEALGHSWAEATCEAPQTCEACAVTEGEALGHTWEEATTDAPETCTVCQATQGEPLDTDDRFTTSSTKPLQGKWVTYMDAGEKELGLEGFQGTLTIALYVEFGNTGDMSMTMGVANEADFQAAMTKYFKDLLMAELAAQGVSEAEADQAMMEQAGMTVDEYAQMAASLMSVDTVFGAFNVRMVYYVEGDQLYTALDWDGTFENETFQITDGVLTMEKTVDEETGEPMQWSRVEE